MILAKPAHSRPLFMWKIKMQIQWNLFPLLEWYAGLLCLTASNYFQTGFFLSPSPLLSPFLTPSFFPSPYYPDAAAPVWGVGAGKAVGGLRIVSSVQGQMQAGIQRRKGEKEWESTNKDAGEVTRLDLMQGGVRSYLLTTLLENISQTHWLAKSQPYRWPE